MSNSLLDVITSALPSTDDVKARKAAKAASALKVKKDKERKAEMKKVLLPTLEALVQADYKTSKLLVKAEGAEYAAFKALVLECEKNGVFQDSKLLKLVQTRISILFTSETIATRRNTMLANTAKVAYGGSVGRESDKTKRAIAGFGWSHVVDVLEKATSIRTYHPLITAAKPEAFKSKPKPEAPKKPKAEKPKGEVITAEQASAAALEVLAQYVKFLLPGSDSKELQLIQQVEVLVSKRLNGLKKAA